MNTAKIVKRYLAVTAFTDGGTYSAIRRRFGMNARSIQRWTKKLRNNEELTDDERMGRPRILSPTDTNFIETELRTPRGNLRRTKRKLEDIEGKIVSTSTILNAAKKIKLRHVRARNKPLLNEKMKKKRLAFATRMTRSPKYWNQVVFIDEKYFELTWGAKSAWIGPNHPIPILPKKKHPPKVMVWGAVSARGKFLLVRIPQGETLKAESYIRLLEENLLPDLPVIFPAKFRPVILEDGAPAHAAKVTNSWYQNNGVVKIPDFPPNSPDLNIMENVWKLLGDKVAARSATNLDELWTALQEEWSNLSMKIIKKIIRSVPDRLDAVVNANGGTTKY